jgi:Glucanosyltransferase
MFLDVASYGTQIDGKNPQWTTSQYTSFTKVIDTFQRYNNVAGFFITNEAVTTPNETAAAPYIKAAVRDTKAYMKQNGGRYIPMGYSAADISSIRPMFQNYLVCGPVEDTIDFFAVNIYEWVPKRLCNFTDRSAATQAFKRRGMRTELPNSRDIPSPHSSAKSAATRSVRENFPKYPPSWGRTCLECYPVPLYTNGHRNRTTTALSNTQVVSHKMEFPCRSAPPFHCNPSSTT